MNADDQKTLETLAAVILSGLYAKSLTLPSGGVAMPTADERKVMINWAVADAQTIRDHVSTLKVD